MANNYTISPGTVVGSQTVTGNSTIQGDLNLHTAQPQGRHLRELSSTFGDGFNADPISLAQDNAANYSWIEQFRCGLGDRRVFRAKPGGANKFICPMYLELSGNNAAANTGNTTENTIYTGTIYGGTMGPFAQLRIWFYVNVTAQGGVATTIRVKLGAATLATITMATVADRLVEYTLSNLGVQNSQKIAGIVHVNGASPTVGVASSAVDTTADQNLVITAQNGAATDSNNIPIVHAIGMFAQAAVSF